MPRSSREASIRSTGIDRRRLLQGAGAALALGLSGRAAAALDRADALFLATCRRPDGNFAVAVLTERGALVREIALPARGHDLAFHPASGRAVAFARRPGTFAVGFDVHERLAPQVFAAQPDRHFFGHGAFSDDGRLLYATENDVASGQGVLGVYDVADGFRRIGELPTYGVGPHEAIMMPGGRLLAVANGGIETNPAYGRQDLNLDTMQPSLAFVDRDSGALVGRHELPAELHQLSVRHMAVAADGQIWFGTQWAGDPLETPPLVGRASLDGGMRLLHTPRPAVEAMRSYIGAVAASRDGTVIAASAPRGGLVAYWDAASGQSLGTCAIADASGIAGMDRDGILASNGHGEVAAWHRGGRVERPAPLDLQFDNHVRRADGAAAV